MAQDAGSNPRIITNYFAVTPSDSQNFTNEMAAIYVGVSGNVVLVNRGGNTVTLQNLAAGMWHGVSFTRINATNTTATGIVAGS